MTKSTITFRIRFKPTQQGGIPEFARQILKELNLSSKRALESQEYKGPPVEINFGGFKTPLLVVMDEDDEILGEVIEREGYYINKLGEYSCGIPHDNQTIEELPIFLANDNLSHLYLRNCFFVKNLERLTHLDGLRYLVLTRCKSLFDLTTMGNLKNLEGLDISMCEDLTDYAFLGELNAIKTLRLFGSEAVKTLTSLENCKNLEILNLGSCGSLADISTLEKLVNLKELNLSGCESLTTWTKGGWGKPSEFTNTPTDLSPLRKLEKLECLNLKSCGIIDDLEPLSTLTSLIDLDLGNCDTLTDLSSLENLKNLRVMNLRGCKSLTDLSALQSLTNLTELNLSRCKALTDLRPLINLHNLRDLDLHNCELITDLEPLANLSRLVSLNLEGCDLLTSEQILHLRCLPELRNLKSSHRREVELVLLETAFQRKDIASIQDHLSAAFDLFKVTKDVRLALTIAKGLALPGVDFEDLSGFMGICLSLTELNREDWGEILLYLSAGRPVALREWLTEQVQGPPSPPLLGGFLRWISRGGHLPDWTIPEALCAWLTLAEKAMDPETFRELGPALCLAWRVLGEEAHLQDWLRRLTQSSPSGFREKILLRFATHDLENGDHASAMRILREMHPESEEAEYLRATLAEALASELPEQAGEYLSELLDEESQRRLARALLPVPGFLEANGNLERLLILLASDPDALAMLLEDGLRRTPKNVWLQSLRDELLPTELGGGCGVEEVVEALDTPIISDCLRPKDQQRIRQSWTENPQALYQASVQLCAFLLHEEGLLDNEDLQSVLKTVRTEGGLDVRKDPHGG